MKRNEKNRKSVLFLCILEGFWLVFRQYLESTILRITLSLKRFWMIDYCIQRIDV